MPSYLTARAAGAAPLTPLTARELQDWLAGQPPRVAAWVEATGFTAKPGSVCLLPGADGALERVLAGIDPDEAVTIVEYPGISPFKIEYGPFLSFASLFGLDDDTEETDVLENPEWTYIRTLIGSRGMPLYMLPPEYYAEEAGMRQ